MAEEEVVEKREKRGQVGSDPVVTRAGCTGSSPGSVESVKGEEESLSSYEMAEFVDCLLRVRSADVESGGEWRGPIKRGFARFFPVEVLGVGERTVREVEAASASAVGVAMALRRSW